ncbi:hypothetical protein [Marinibacterium profundimaris]|uniref:hypothetical protein n=1 Tax=Marinibacterium profundimaris TaxID=1679460 RepID=UPI0018E95A69|nr:hypothetical protein [Marinibacterium profundimaris]
MVGFETELPPVRLRGAQAMKPLDRLGAVRPRPPFAHGGPPELRGFGRICQRFPRLQQRGDVNPVVYRNFRRRHAIYPQGTTHVDFL